MLVIYGDLLSQPSRAVVLFCKLTHIPYKFQLINIQKGEHQTPSFLAINPDGKVPAIQDGEFSLGESHAILIYLARSRGCADHWYPSDLKKRAIVDRYFHWHHSYLRHAGFLLREMVLAPLQGRKPAAHVIEESPIVLKKALSVMESWLRKQAYLAGEEISIADVSALCEIAQLELIHYDFSPYPRVKEWYQSLRSIPEVKETHSLLDKLVTKISINQKL